MGLTRLSKGLVQPELILKPTDNLIINGNFDFWRRGLNFTLTESGYTTDRWFVYSNGASVVALSTDVPHGNATRSMSLTGDYWYHGAMQIIENGAIICDNSPISISAMVKGPEGKTAAISVGWITDGELYTFTGDWQKIKTVVEIPAGFAGLSANAGGVNLYVHPVRCINQGTLEDGDEVKISQVKVELGHVVTPFYPRQIALEDYMCKRYYEYVSFSHLPMIAADTSSIFSYIRYVQKRVVPSFTYSGAYTYRLAYGWQEPESFVITPQLSYIIVNHIMTDAFVTGNSYLGLGNLYLNAEL